MATLWRRARRMQSMSSFEKSGVTKKFFGTPSFPGSKRGMFLSSLFIFGTAVLCCVALISNIDLVWDVPIPTLVLANRMNPAFGLLFAAVIFVGIYTSAVPLLWTGVKRIAVEGSSRYKLVVVFGGVIGCIIACLIPYAPLLNVLYGLNGYLGFVLMAFMLVHDVGSLVRK